MGCSLANMEWKFVIVIKIWYYKRYNWRRSRIFKLSEKGQCGKTERRRRQKGYDIGEIEKKSSGTKWSELKYLILAKSLVGQKKNQVKTVETLWSVIEDDYRENLQDAKIQIAN